MAGKRIGPRTTMRMEVWTTLDITYMKSLTTIHSSILDSTGLIDIGRKSDSMHGDATVYY